VEGGHAFFTALSNTMSEIDYAETEPYKLKR
jgi:hypothetical protein